MGRAGCIVSIYGAWVTGLLGSTLFFPFLPFSHLSDSSLGRFSIEQGLARCLHHLPVFTHCYQHVPCCIASAHPGSRRAGEPKIFESRALDQCRTAAASRPPACLSCEQLRPRQVMAGIQKPGREPHTYLICPPPCGAVLPMPS